MNPNQQRLTKPKLMAGQSIGQTRSHAYSAKSSMLKADTEIIVMAVEQDEVVVSIAGQTYRFSKEFFEG